MLLGGILVPVGFACSPSSHVVSFSSRGPKGFTYSNIVNGFEKVFLLSKNASQTPKTSSDGKRSKISLTYKLHDNFGKTTRPPKNGGSRKMELEE